MRICKKCGEEKELKDFYFRNKKRGWRNHTCKSCKNSYMRQFNRTHKYKKVCENCGKKFLGSKKITRFCSGTCQNTGRFNPTWKGGIKRDKGYVYLLVKNHPRASAGYVSEHRLVMEKKLGRYLKPNELVYHKNGVKSDNRIENLEIIQVIKHPDFHTGKVTCPYCHEKFSIK